MLAYLATLFFIFGTVVGSFLNVVILRYDRMPLTGRSGCPSCGRVLGWKELVPVLSFLIQRGRCRGCDHPISRQYPLVEVATGLVFLAIFFFLIDFYQVSNIYEIPLIFFGSSFLILASVWGLLVAIFVYDLYHKIIPDDLVFPFIFLSLLWLFHSVSPDEFLSFPSLWDLFIGPFMFLFFASLWFFSKGTWMGFGDAKLALGMGFLLGFYYGLSAFMLSFWIGAGVALALLAFRSVVNDFGSQKAPAFLKNIGLKSEIPFAPFLIIGTALAFFFHMDAFGIISLFGI